MGINNFAAAVVAAGLFSIAPAAPAADPAVAPTMGFFLDDWQAKRWVAPEFKEMGKGTGGEMGGDVVVTIDPGEVITRIPNSIYGHNANTWMSAMITEPVFMRHVNDLHPHVIRWPAGSGSDGYWWNRAPGNPPDDAPKMVLDQNGKKKNVAYFYGRPFGGRSGSLDAYYEMRRETGNEGLITVNYGYARYGTGPHPVETAAHYAADWVRYDRGRTRYWEVGNENYGFWELGFRIDTTQNKDGQPEILTGELYATHFKVFADSMRAAAKELGVTIYIGAVTAESKPMPFDTKTRKTWNPEMLKVLGGAVGSGGGVADYYVVHNYFTPYKKNSTAAEVLHDAATVPQEQMSFVLRSLAEAGAPVKPVAMGEWNMFATGSMQQVSETSGLFADIVIGETLKNKYGLACRWDMLNSWEGGNDHGLFSAGDEQGVTRWSPRPSFYHLYFLQKMQGDRLVATVSGDSSILAYGTTFTSGEVNVTLVNVSSMTRTVRFEGKGYKLGKRFYWYTLSRGADNVEFSRQVVVNGEGPSAVAGGPDDYATIPAWSAPAAGGIRVTVPAYGAVFLTVGK